MKKKQTKQKSATNSTERLIFAPCSEKQRVVLQDKTTDVILVGG